MTLGDTKTDKTTQQGASCALFFTKYDKSHQTNRAAMDDTRNMHPKMKNA
jgi:hypothetical protein